MTTYKIVRLNRRDPNNSDNSWNNIVTESIMFEGTIKQARKEAYRISRESNTVQVEVRYSDNHAPIGQMAGVNGAGNENLWTVPDDKKPLGFRHMKIDKNGRIEEFWRA